MKKIEKIKEKVELKDMEVMDSNPCRHGGGHCASDCCRDCYNHSNPYISDLY